jgi:hypothetical protein
MQMDEDNQDQQRQAGAATRLVAKVGPVEQAVEEPATDASARVEVPAPVAELLNQPGNHDVDPEDGPQVPLANQAGDDAGDDGHVGQLRPSFFKWRAKVLEVTENEEPQEPQPEVITAKSILMLLK